MKVEFKDTFFESVEKLVWYDSKLWKVWEFIRRGIPTFFGNIWRFRKELYSHQWWDYRYTLEMLHRSLVIMVTKLETDGIEEDGSRGKKVAKIKRAIQLIQNRLDDNYVEQAEKELGELVMRDWEFEPTENGTYTLKDNESKEEKEHNSKVFRLAQTIDDREWRELWNIFKGQSTIDFKKYKKTLPKEEQATAWDTWFNGSDMRGWWD
jgi:hypothetical protein